VDARAFVETCAGRGWLGAWLSSSADMSRLASLDRALRDSMAGFQARSVGALSGLNAGLCLATQPRSFNSHPSFPSQAVISVETLTSVKALLAQGPPAYEADPQEAALRAFVAQHGRDKVLASPELRGQLASKLGIETAVLQGELQALGAGVAKLDAKMDVQGAKLDAVLQQVLTLEADAWAFLPKGLTPELRSFWQNQIGAKGQVPWSSFATLLLSQTDVAAAVVEVEARLSAEFAGLGVAAAAAEGGTFMHVVLRANMDLDGDGSVQARAEAAAEAAAAAKRIAEAQRRSAAQILLGSNVARFFLLLLSQAFELLALLQKCALWASSSGQPEPRDLAACVRLLAVNFDRSVLDAALQADLVALRAALKPLAFSAEVGSLMGYYVPGTRAWLLKRFDAWLAAGAQGGGALSVHQSRAFVVAAGPGVGKSTFSAMLCRLRSEAVTAFHFCRYGDAEKAAPRRLLCSLAFQLAQRLPAARAALRAAASDASSLGEATSLDALFDRVLLQPLAAVDAAAVPGGQIVLLVDALDEAAAAGGRNELMRIITSRFRDLPRWVRFVLTTRPRDEREGAGLDEAGRDLLRPLLQFTPMTIEVRFVA
jgi:hypothetical protein